MPYAPPSNYPFIQRYRVDNLTPSKERHTVQLNGLGAATNADGLLRTILSQLNGYRWEFKNPVVFTKLGTAVTPILSLVHYNIPGTITFSRVDIPINTLFLQFGPPQFALPILYGDAMDIIFNDQNTLKTGDSLILQYELEKIYEG